MSAVPLNVLSDRSLDDFVMTIRDLRRDIIALRQKAHGTTGEVREHYKFVIADHIWRLTQVIGAFWRESCGETAIFDLPDLRPE